MSVSSGYSASPSCRLSSSVLWRPPRVSTPLARSRLHTELVRSLVRSEYCFARERARLLSTDVPSCSRPWSTLRPVIKQPRGRQIESVEETRERRRRGDGQPAATMVSIVKGLSWRVRVPPNLKQSNEEGNAGIAEGGL